MATKTRRRKQPYLDGMDPRSIAEIDKAAEAYVEARDSRMASLKTEIALGEELLALMRQHELQTYEFDGQVVSVVALEKVKVKKAKGGDDDNGTDDEGE